MGARAGVTERDLRRLECRHRHEETTMPTQVMTQDLEFLGTRARVVADAGATDGQIGRASCRERV
jgi:hypothetical protein